MEDAVSYVFGYASLVSPESVGLTLGRPVDPGGFVFATLDGWRREWSVGSDISSHPERSFIGPDGSEFEGVVAVLGVSRAAGSSCGGAVFPVSGSDMSILDVRERNYTRVDVTEQIDWPGKPPRCVVHTYTPAAEAVERIRLALRDGRPVRVRLGYLELVRAAFTGQGYSAEEPEFAEPPFPVEDLRIVLDRRSGP